MNKRLINLSAIVALGLACQTVFAAPGWRGTTESTFQQWSSWTTSSGYVAPDAGWHNSFGTPTMLVKSGELDLTIPNNPAFLPQLPKSEMWIELDWKVAGISPAPDSPSIGFNFDYTGEHIPPMTPGADILQYSTTVGNDGWSTTIFQMVSWPKPAKETLTITGDIYTNRISVDTRCIPEPCTLLLLGLGAAVITRKR